LLNQVTGKSDIIPTDTLATKILGNYRNVATSVKLGSAFIMAISHFPIARNHGQAKWLAVYEDVLGIHETDESR
jgi:hypothetical protein